MTDKSKKSQEGREAGRSVARIREVIDQVEELEDVGDHFENAKTLLGKLKTKQRRTIMESALTSHLEEEDLKPYQAELIKMQAHLESTGRKAIILFDGRDAAGKGGTIRRVTRSLDFKLNPDIVIPGDRELKIMEKQLARKGAFKE